jgi:hypothetical protein
MKNVIFYIILANGVYYNQFLTGVCLDAPLALESDVAHKKIPMTL